MKDHAYRPFFLTLFVVVLLTIAHWLPTLHLGDTQLRRIDLLSDLGNDSTKGDFHDVIPKPKEPERLLAKNKAGQTVAFKEVWPKGVERIVDFSAGSANGMDHFYAMLDSVKRKQLKGRPLRIAYFGDSFIEADITTFNRFTIDGFLQKDFFDEQPAEAHARWKDVREHCFRIIRGQRTPLNFKIVLSLAPSHFDAFLKKEQLTGFTAGDIQGLNLNFHYDGTDLHCITGTSLRTFTLDKSLEHAWDQYVRSFLLESDLDTSVSV